MALSLTPPPLQSAPPPASAFPGASLLTAGVLVFAVAALYFGRHIFVPFALAVLLSFILAPLVVLLRRLHVPRAAAVIAAVLLAVAVIGSLTVVVGTQAVQLASNLPSYQQNIEEKLHSLRRSAPGEGTLGKVSAVIADLSKELSGTEEPADAADGNSALPAPVPPTVVAVREADTKPLEVIRSFVGPVLRPIGTVGIVIVFVIFILLEREDLRDRFIRLVGGGDLHRSTEVLNEAARRVSRYLLMQLVVNATYGIPIGIGLYIIGVPNALLWGLLATLLRFIPYLGPVIAAVFPIALAIAVDPGWSMVLWTIMLFVVLELISNNMIEPWLYGSSTGLSSLAVLAAAMFWTTLWGPVGLLLATPLTVCLVVIGRYVPQFEFLGVLLGSDPVLTPEQRLYQRLLSANPEEAIEIAEAYVDDESLDHFYDDVAIPALCLAENDRERRALAPEQQKVIAEGARRVAQELVDHENRDVASSARQANAAGEPTDAAVAPGPRWPRTPVLCVPGRGDLDAAAAEMLAHFLEHHGIRARALSQAIASQEAVRQLDLAGVEVICLSYLRQTPEAHARYVCRRLRRRAPNVKIIAGFWNLAPAAGNLEEIASVIGADVVVSSFASTAGQIEGWIKEFPVPAMIPPPVLIDEQERLQALRESGLLDEEVQERLDQIARKLAQAFEVPTALVSLIDETKQIWRGAAGLPSDLDQTREAPRELSVCGYVVAANQGVVVEDVALDLRFAGNPFLREHGIRFYAGAALRSGSGHTLGSLCLIDTQPRSFSERDRRVLQVFADELMAEMELRRQTRQRPFSPDDQAMLSTAT